MNSVNLLLLLGELDVLLLVEIHGLKLQIVGREYLLSHFLLNFLEYFLSRLGFLPLDFDVDALNLLACF